MHDGWTRPANLVGAVRFFEKFQAVYDGGGKFMDAEHLSAVRYTRILLRRVLR
jgi:glutamine amidotransferase-like uncharacterized protein